MYSFVFIAGARAVYNAYYARRNSSSVVNYIYCTGNEAQISACTYSSASQSSCGRYNNAGVACTSEDITGV